MRITQQTDSRLILAGVPGGRGWMAVLAGFGLLLNVGVGWFAFLLYRELQGLAWAHLPLGIGLLIAQALFWTGVITLAVGRLRLVLDTTVGRGEYRVRSPIVDAGRACTFDLEQVHSITIETSTETRPGGPERAEREATVHRVRLRLSKPRRAITLDETEHGHLDRLDALAQQVAAFLGKTPERIDYTSR